MYLLILSGSVRRCCACIVFTSHYVSINSSQLPSTILLHLHLHPTMYLLIPEWFVIYTSGLDNLHPTMYLLIH